MIDVYHCPKCGRLLTCEGVVSVDGEDLPVFQCEDCIVKRAVFGVGKGARYSSGSSHIPANSTLRLFLPQDGQLGALASAFAEPA